MKRTLLRDVIIVNEDEEKSGCLLIEGDNIAQIIGEDSPISAKYDEVIEGNGCYLLPGLIDEHVHFREPGFTQKATIYSESRAAAAGGITSYFDMPNTNPQTTTIEKVQEKENIAKRDSLVNFSFYLGATQDNIDRISKLSHSSVCGVKVFMGSSTGNMLVDDDNCLLKLFKESPLPIVTHCEDVSLIRQNILMLQKEFGTGLPLSLHSWVRSTESCYRSTSKAISLAKETGARLHVAHISSAKELELFTPEDDKISAEACISHLFFNMNAYPSLGAKIKCNPSVKTKEDQTALIQALSSGRIRTVATDHAPHLWTDKKGDCLQAASGMPSIQYSLISMLELVSQGVLSVCDVTRLMCHNPSRLFGVHKRGYIREGYKADLVLVSHGNNWTVTRENILSKCGWSPFEGRVFQWEIEKTFCNGTIVYDRNLGIINKHAAEPILFDR